MQELQEKGADAADPGGADGGADPAFGATIAALQDQLREVTREKDEAVRRAAAAAAAGGVVHQGGDGVAASDESSAAAAVAAREQLEAQEKVHQEALAEKQSQNEQLVQKVRQLLNTCRSLKEQVAEAAQRPPVDGGGSTAAEGGSDAEGLQAQLALKQSENDKLMARLRELAQRYRGLQQEQQEGGGVGGGGETAAFAERLAEAERRVAAGDERAAELSRCCEEAEAEHQRVTGSLKEAVERLAVLESGAGAAEGAAAAADEGRSALEEQLRGESAALEGRVAGLEGELRVSEEEKREALTRLEAKTADFDKIVSAWVLFFFGVVRLGGDQSLLLCPRVGVLLALQQCLRLELRF